ncbi:uncharacterized protein EKO05_0002965 [Ascochyta rabiei]|uniref:Uncharacterized protein n=1 Tax=Didymella rabiei TaxID=5454 RepID=A0A162X7E7_DIDRA|nr:uncharacterized protein EKO05_0002965 [Ascochyta rabiei]KZM19383.1 hypothetical protein ST47_g9485 [Ascochyta rabiei]UPX12417.1 hypothetical protein EKO05_0002965 [Ascochyta rabiei]
MPTIGAQLRKWTAFLLLCSTPTTVLVQSTNNSVTFHTGATAPLSVTTHGASPALSRPTAFSRPYADTDTICSYRTINYITHTLPQQCLKTSWSASIPTVSINETAPAAETTPTPQTSASTTKEGAEEWVGESTGDAAAAATASSAEVTPSGDIVAGSGTGSTEPDAELETDSPFDNANFLSFDEWKKRNLAQAGQSPENVGQGRAASAEQGSRRRPVNVNALDSLGEEAEIDIDFSGFGDPSEGSSIGSDVASKAPGAEAAKASGEADKAGSGSWALSKDAGKTCKERFNYASFDCAATVLKTNKKAKGSSAVLSEHKDSYMLNECSVNNKFLIIELCDDILIDTVVLANYEFFSSMFRHFRVSVSDRYPVKMERWRTLATFEARNSRDIQPFLITEPQIWARYLRIEFLTHYGNEFYCPLSLLRVHGTTMMEQFRRDEEEARGGEDDVESIEEEENVVKPADGSGPIPADQVPIVSVEEELVRLKQTATSESSPNAVIDTQPTSSPTVSQPTFSSPTSASAQVVTSTSLDQSTGAPSNNSAVDSLSRPSPSSIVSKPGSGNDATALPPTPSSIAVASQDIKMIPSAQGSAVVGSNPASGTSTTRKESAARSPGTDAPSPPTKNPPAKQSSNNTAANPPVQSQTRSSPTQPNAAAPSTQESFFKSIHKRLQYLEANSTLSLQYIEEQSRILRDAFIKVEKKQLAKTEKFLEYMNTTVIQELKNYRNMYEQLWQSTVIELEGMKERQRSEVGEIGARLSLMADELVWQKRMAVVQSTLLLLCLGLVLFARSGAMGAAVDMPIVQQLGTKYSSFFDSPPQRGLETGVDRRRRTFKSMWRSDTSAGLSDRSGHHSEGRNILSDVDSDDARSPVRIQYSPPTPNTPGGRSDAALQSGSSPPDVNGLEDVDSDGGPAAPRKVPDISLEDQAKRIQVLATQSGPATPNGTRDSRPSWEEVDRAIDQLKAEEHDQAAPQKEVRVKGKARSPLRRAQSSYDGAGDDNSPIDSGRDHLVSS